MTLLGEFNAYGERFEIEPPVEIGEHFIYSLGQLAMIAANGHDSDPRILEGMAGAIDNTLYSRYEREGIDGFASLLTQFVAMHDGNHVFTRS